MTRAAAKQAMAILPILVLYGAPARAAFDVALPYPTEVALSEEGDKGYVFRRFPGAQRLYTYDLDHGGQSYCNQGCEGARPPVIAPATAHPLGEWSVVRRYDGRLQWAYRGHPVYSLFHDAPSSPTGDGEGGVWHLLPYEK